MTAYWDQVDGNIVFVHVTDPQGKIRYDAAVHRNSKREDLERALKELGIIQGSVQHVGKYAPKN